MLPQKAAAVRDSGDADGEALPPAGRSFDERSTDRLAAVHVVTEEEAAAGEMRCVQEVHNFHS